MALGDDGRFYCGVIRVPPKSTINGRSVTNPDECSFFPSIEV